MDGLRRPQQARAVRTRLGLLEAGAAEFSQRGYARTTTRSIAARAGVSTGSYYEYFLDKNALLRELAIRYLQQAAEVSLGVLEPSAPAENAAFDFVAELRRRLRELCTATLAFRREDPGLQRVFRERRFADAELQSRWLADERGVIDRVTTLLDRWQIEKSSARAVVLYAMVDGAMEALVEHGSVDDDQVLDLLVDALVGVVVPHPARNVS